MEYFRYSFEILAQACLSLNHFNHVPTSLEINSIKNIGVGQCIDTKQPFYVSTLTQVDFFSVSSVCSGDYLHRCHTQ